LQAHQGLTLYFLGKLHSGLKKLSAYYRQRGVKVFNITTPEELERALSLSRPHALVIDLQSRSDITRFFDVLDQHEGLLELPRVAIISSTTDQETAEALMAQADESVVWPLKATDLSLKLFNMLVSRGQFVRFQRDARDEDGRFYRGEIYASFLRDVLQLLYLGRKDAILSLESEGRRGNLYFKEGKLIDAQVGALEWEDSLALVRRFKSGTFVLSFQPVDRKKFIEKNVAAWLAQQDEDGDTPAVPEPGEATAISSITDPGTTDSRAAAPMDEDETTSSGVILGGAAAAAAAIAAAASEVTRPLPERDRLAAVEPPSDPMTTQPTPQATSNGFRATPPARPAEPGPGAPRPAAEPTEPARTAATQPVRTTPSMPSTPPPDPRSGREARVGVALLLVLVAVLGGIYLFRARPQPVPVAKLETPAPTPRPIAQPPEPTPPRVREIPPAPTPVAVVPTPSVQIREIDSPPIKPNLRAEQRAPGVREIVQEPTPKPAVKAEKPTPAPRPDKGTTQVKAEVKPTPTPAPVLPTPAPTPTAVAMVTPPKPTEPPASEVGIERPEKGLARKARELEKAGKLQEALAVYTQVAELDPSSREASEAIARLKGGTAEINPMAPGELHINSFPYGIVYVDGEKQGYTPIHLSKATPRKYLIRVVNPDFGTCSTEVVVKPGERKWVQLRLDDNENCLRSKSAP
jgi:hypothetical protein